MVRREGADVPRRDPVHGIGIVRYLDAVSGQLAPKSYRPRAGDRGRCRQRIDLLGEFLRTADERLPEPLPVRCVERGEDLAAVAVEDGQPLALGPRLADPRRQRVEGADAAGRQAGRGGQAAGGGDPDPQAGEGAGPEADRDPLDPLPAAGGVGDPLDFAQQPGRVPGLPIRGEPQPRLEQNLTVAPAAGGGVGGSGVEADENQRVP